MKEHLCQHSDGSDEPQSLLAKQPKGCITSLWRRRSFAAFCISSSCADQLDENPLTFQCWYFILRGFWLVGTLQFRLEMWLKLMDKTCFFGGWGRCTGVLYCFKVNTNISKVYVGKRERAWGRMSCHTAANCFWSAIPPWNPMCDIWTSAFMMSCFNTGFSFQWNFLSAFVLQHRKQVF